MKKILSLLIVALVFFTACNDSSTAENKTSSATITNKKEATEAVSLIQSLRLNVLAGGIGQSLAPQVSANKVQSYVVQSYPIPYSIQRDCNVNGTALTEGSKLSDTEYDANNTFTQCEHIPGIVIDGVNHVSGQLNGDNFYAELTQNQIGVTMGELSMQIASPMKFYSNKAMTQTTTVLDGEVGLTEYSNSYSATFSDFNVSIDSQNATMQLNGDVEITACGKENFNIETLEPLHTAANGSYTSGKLKVNGAIFEYNSNKTVTVTLADTTVYTLGQSMDVMCTLDSGSVLIGSLRDADSHAFLEGVSITAETGVEIQPTSTQAQGIYTAQSDINGNFRFKDLIAGEYRLSFTKDGYIPASASFTVHQEREENIGQIELTPIEHQDLDVTFSGIVRNAQSGSSVGDVNITIHEGYNNPTGDVFISVLSDSNGNFSAEIPTGYYTLVLVKDGFVTSSNISISLAADKHQELTITPVVSATEAVITLTWGANPRDLDSFLYKDGEYQIYYGNKTVDLGEETANLDVDDTSSFGPETITLDNIDSSGLYTYKVHHYSGSESIATSDAVVTVNFGDTTYTFRPPNQSGRLWTVFTVEDGVLNPCIGTCIQ